jgi:hypothetical protein
MPEFIMMTPKNVFLGTKNDEKADMSEMQRYKEDMFSAVYRAEGIDSVTVYVVNAEAVVRFHLRKGEEGIVVTKRGETKKYRIETALKWLQSVGLAEVRVRMGLSFAGGDNWDERQHDLLNGAA